MSDIRCGNCHAPLSHIDEACPTCLPGFYGASQRAPVPPLTEGEIVELRALLGRAIAEAEEERKPLIAKALEDVRGAYAEAKKSKP